MHVVGILPARAGSKRVPRKNIKDCGGKPLLAWTCEAALAAASIDRLILSTDEQAVADIGRAHGADVPFLRPPNLAGDAAPMLPVIADVVARLGAAGERPDAIVLLQPTSPLREARHIDEAVGLLRGAMQSVVSVMAVPGHVGRSKFMRRFQTADGPCVVDARDDLPQFDDLVIRNGPAIVVTRSAVIEAGMLYGDPLAAYEMPEEASIDIDTPLDFAVADALLRHRQGG